MKLLNRILNFFSKDLEKELNEKFVIVFGLTSWVEVYDKGNEEYLNNKDVKVYNFTDGITYYGIKNPSEQPGLSIGICSNEQIIKKYAKKILSYITNRNCDYQFIEDFKFSMKDHHINL